MDKVFYHVSKHLFDAPDYDLILQNIQGHANGALGLWFCTASCKNHFASYGQYLYKIHFDDEAKIFFMPLRNVAKLSNEEVEFFRLLRAEYLAQGYSAIAIMEQDHRVEMGIILDFNAIKSFTLENQHETY